MNELWQRARAETPGCANVLHFNNAGAALMPSPVIDAVQKHLQLEAQIGGYEALERALEESNHFYDATARLIGCSSREIAYVENATRAWDMAFYSIPFRKGDRILTARAEYASNYIAFLQLEKKAGVKIDVVPNDESGQLSVAALAQMMDDRVKLVAITHVPTNGGLINPAAQIGAITRKAGVLYLLDACQSVGQMPVNVGEIGCDMLTATGRKFLRGPRATGFLYMRSDLIPQIEPVFLDLHSARWVSPGSYEVLPDARRFENWEQNYAGKIGLGVAMDYAMQWGLEKIRDRVFALADLLRSKLATISGVRVADIGAQKCGIVTFQCDTDATMIKSELSKRKIHVTVASSTGALLDMQARGIQELIRASVHYYNTEEEVERFCQELAIILKHGESAA
jgi:cysteine desulfurase/selenocysteine lyase